MSKIDLITKVYYDPAGFGSLKQTLEDAKKHDSTITAKDVKDWKDKNVQRTTQLRGDNSFIASKPYEEFQMDLCFFNDLKPKDFVGALLMVDIFTKYISVIPIVNKQIPTVLEATKEAIKKMGGKPETIYSDNEGAFVSNVIQAYFKENNIRHLITSSHAPVAERSIRTIKEMIYPRVEKTQQEWNEVLYAVLLTYNNKLVSRITHMTPQQAMKPGNHVEVKMHLEMHRRTGRKYPEIHVGDSVKTFKKKDKLDKGHVSTWTPNYYRVDAISESMGQKFYKLSTLHRQYLRYELLLTK